MKEKKELNANKFMSPRNLMPEIHDKTHFIAAYSLMLNNEGSM
jgi:hypothetical protein